MSDHKYRLTYAVNPQPEGLTKDQLKGLGPDIGACDKIILHSIIEPEDGSLSTMIVSLDGKTGKPLDPEDIWKHWTLMAHHLKKTLPKGTKQELAETVVAIVRRMIAGDKEKS